MTARLYPALTEPDDVPALINSSAQLEPYAALAAVNNPAATDPNSTRQ
ncbi:MAG TPA: hypothetical protein VNO31_23695 [Umezawaea sp.]|nr:hypothetical protein [Umezawaea sp.]